MNRHTGVAEGSKDHFLHVHQGSFNETLTIFDLLCCGKKEIVLAGTYARTNSLKERSKAARLRPAFTTAAPHGMTGMWNS